MDDAIRATGRRNRVRSAVLVVLFLLASSCADGGNGGNAKPATAPDTRLLRVGAPVDTFTVDPPNRATVTTFGAHGSVLETLLIAGPDLSLRPLLATGWQFVPPATWRFELRQGVTFHNGAPFNAEAVVATLNGRLVGGSVRANLTPTSAKATGPFTVEVTTNPPNSRMIYQFAHPNTGIVAPGTNPGIGTSPENTPTGTGPYRFASYTPKSELRVRRNDGYWGTKPAYEEVLFRFMPDGTSRVLALKAGDVDAIYDVPREQVANLEKEGSFEIVKSKTGAVQFLTLNMKGNPPYDLLRDADIRKAIAQGVNSDAIVRSVWPGGAEVSRTVLPPALLGNAASMIKGYAFNPAAARAQLDQAGWSVGSDGVRTKGGRRLSLTMQVYLPDEQRPLPELVKDQLAQIGIAVDIKVPADTSTFFDLAAKGEGDIFSDAASTGVEHPLGPGTFFPTGSSRGFLSPGAEYDKLYVDAFSATNEEEFRRIAGQLMHILVDEAVLLVPIAGVFRIYGLSDKLEGFEPYTFIYSQRWHTVAPKG